MITISQGGGYAATLGYQTQPRWGSVVRKEIVDAFKLPRALGAWSVGRGA